VAKVENFKKIRISPKYFFTSRLPGKKLLQYGKTYRGRIGLVPYAEAFYTKSLSPTAPPIQRLDIFLTSGLPRDNSCNV
jgi:hypothetical protein